MTCHAQILADPAARLLAHDAARTVALWEALAELHWACALEGFWRTTPIAYPSKRAMVAMLAGGEE